MVRSAQPPAGDRGRATPIGPDMLRQPIARAARGLDHLRALHRRQRLAQALDMHADRALLDEHMVAPHAVEQLRPAVHPLRVGHEEVQQAEFGRPDLDLAPVARHAARRRVEPQAGHLDRVVERLGPLRRSTARMRAISSFGENGLLT